MKQKTKKLRQKYRNERTRKEKKKGMKTENKF